MPNLTTDTKRIIIIGIFALSVIAGLSGQWQILNSGLIGLLALVNPSSDSN